MDGVLELNNIRNGVTELGKMYGAERIYLFGSYARGDAKSDSDIDFRIDKGNIRGLFKLAGLQMALEKKFGRKVDLLTTDSLDQKFLKSISDEEILLYDNK